MKAAAPRAPCPDGIVHRVLPHLDHLECLNRLNHLDRMVGEGCWLTQPARHQELDGDDVLWRSPPVGPQNA
jgi:hypothetical protein